MMSLPPTKRKRQEIEDSEIHFCETCNSKLICATCNDTDIFNLYTTDKDRETSFTYLYVT